MELGCFIVVSCFIVVVLNDRDPDLLGWGFLFVLPEELESSSVRFG